MFGECCIARGIYRSGWSRSMTSNFKLHMLWNITPRPPKPSTYACQRRSTTRSKRWPKHPHGPRDALHNPSRFVIARPRAVCGVAFIANSARYWPQNASCIPSRSARHTHALSYAEHPKSFLAINALTHCVQTESWQLRDIQEDIKEADAGEFATDKQVNSVFAKYGA